MSEQTVDNQKETRGFQSEVKQLLHLMIHSLYSNKEIFLRELISNASDAADKLRFKALSKTDLYGNDADLCVKLAVNPQAGTLTISDNGIGMTREQAIEHLGTIAKSGTKEFFAQLDENETKDSQLIGQFGVGFYSAFIVAGSVTVNTRSAEVSADEGVCWTSAGEGDYSIETITKANRGTEIILHLRADEQEFLDEQRLREIVGKYSDHIGIPVFIQTEEQDEEGKVTGTKWDQINKAQALWTRNKSDISDEEYKEFYNHVAHDYAEPLTWSHNRVEGKQDYTSLLYIPSKAPWDLNNRDGEQYQSFWKEFGQVLKEGLAEDFSNRDKIAALLRFSSTDNDTAEQTVSLTDYISRMQEGQEKIYYLTADNFNAAKHSPHLEQFRAKGLEVILMYDRIDEYLMGHLPEFEGKKFQAITKSDLDLSSFDNAEEKEKQKETEKEFTSVTDRTKTYLGERVKEVRPTFKLHDTPAVMVTDENEMGTQMAKLLAAAGHEAPEVQYIFELNPEHSLVKQMADEADEEVFGRWVELLFGEAMLAERGTMDDPSQFLAAVNKLLVK
jgi:molecular chaperone HtpG